MSPRSPGSSSSRSNWHTSTANSGPPTTPNTSGLATFRLDVKYTRVASAFAAAGITTILLKGPAFDQLLFGGTRSRAYSDIDLLVESPRVAAAERLLEGLGFHRAEQESAALRRLLRRATVAVEALGAQHATTWIRRDDRFIIDLHDKLPQVGASPKETWRALSGHRTKIVVVGTRVETLDPAASALLIGLHAAHHGPGWNRARSDLERACEVLERGAWDGAVLLARDLRAEAAMGIGLGTTKEGRALARELGLATKPTLAHRVRWSRAWRELGPRA